MPALNFQARFAPLVEAGEKTQTIRARRKDGRDPKPGDRLYLYTGMRTKSCRKLATAECTSVKPIKVFRLGAVIDSDGHDDVRAGGAAESFASADGFESYAEMAGWFYRTHGLPFNGLLIRWKIEEAESDE